MDDEYFDHFHMAEFVAKPELIAQTVGQTALVVKGYFDQLNAENNEIIGDKVKPMRRSVTKFGNGTVLGRQAGDKVQLHRQVR